MNFKDYIYEFKSGITLSPQNFLPVIFASSIDFQSLMEGNISLKPVVRDRENYIKVFREKYPDTILNLADFYTLGFSLFPLEYQDHQFIKIFPKFRKCGEKAIIITNPAEFIARISDAIHRCFPNVRYPEIASAQYKKVMPSPAEFDIYARPWKDRWKKEFFIFARINPNLGVSNLKLEDVSINIGSLSELVVCVDTENLIKGRFPEALRQEELQNYMDSFQPVMQEIKGWAFSVMAEVMDIEPTEHWIELFRDALPEGDWIANATIEKLFADGEGMPRLVFHHKDGMDRIVIGINKITFNFNSMKQLQLEKVQQVLDIINQHVNAKVQNNRDAKFCRMSVETNANLGTVRDRWALKKDLFIEQSVNNHKGLIVTRKMETDYCISPNILGLNSSQRSWHYTIVTATPSDETMLLYSFDDVMAFFHDAAEYNIKQVQQLMKGDPYARYCKMQKYR